MVTPAASIPWPAMVPRICVFRGCLLRFSLESCHHIDDAVSAGTVSVVLDIH